MKTSSYKAKGRRLQQTVASKLSELLNIPCGKDAEIESREMGQTGADIKLYGKAKELFSYSIECKNQEKWSMFQWIEQAKKNKSENTDWLLVSARNRMAPVVTLDFDVFLSIIAKIIK